MIINQVINVDIEIEDDQVCEIVVKYLQETLANMLVDIVDTGGRLNFYDTVCYAAAISKVLEYYSVPSELEEYKDVIFKQLRCIHHAKD
jgi:hypothetical protein